MARLSFLNKTLRRMASGQPRTCPHCGSPDTVLLQRKKLFPELRSCRQCDLMYRYPKDDETTSLTFYQSDYREGMTTEMPSPEELGPLKAENFSGTDKDLAQNISLVKQEKSDGRLLDYGCSWGYGVHQFRQAGYEAIGFEISKPRAGYGHLHLGVEILDDPKEIDDLPPASFDVIHTSHVLEPLRFNSSPYTSPYEPLDSANLEGDELLVIARPAGAQADG